MPTESGGAARRRFARLSSSAELLIAFRRFGSVEEKWRISLDANS
jgi:hypothetical protein